MLGVEGEIAAIIGRRVPRGRITGSPLGASDATGFMK